LMGMRAIYEMPLFQLDLVIWRRRLGKAEPIPALSLFVFASTFSVRLSIACTAARAAAATTPTTTTATVFRATGNHLMLSIAVSQSRQS
jgi:hypothetical protein